MTYKVIFSVLILAFNTAFFECTGANIFIKKADNRTDEITFECGKNVTLTCMFKNSFAVEWMNEKNETGIARCVQNKCTLTPVYVGQYSISSDMLRKIFNLTILKVTMKDDGRRLVCSDGSYTDSVILRVNDNKPRLLEDTQSGTIKAASGCVSLGTKVSFKWKKISKIDNFEEEFFPKIQFKNSRSCPTDADCGHDHTEIVYVTANEDGQYHFKIEALYGSEIKESDISVNKYITISKGTGSENHLNTLFGVLVPMSFCLSIFAVISILIIICIYCTKRKRETYQDNRNQSNRQIHYEETATSSANDRVDEEPLLQSLQHNEETATSSANDRVDEEIPLQSLIHYEGTATSSVHNRDDEDISPQSQIHYEETATSSANDRDDEEPLLQSQQHNEETATSSANDRVDEEIPLQSLQHNEETATYSAHGRVDEEPLLRRLISEGEEGSLPANRNNDEIHRTDQQQDIENEIRQINSNIVFLNATDGPARLVPMTKVDSDQINIIKRLMSGTSR